MNDDRGGHPRTGPIADLQARLAAAADRDTKAWFESYLKGAIAYRGVKTPGVARIVSEWHRSCELHRLGDDDRLDLASRLIREAHAEDKLAGILYLQRYLLRRLDSDAILTEAENLFAQDAFLDWSTCDWFSVRVLGPSIVRHGLSAAERIAGWRASDGLWQRRSAIVPFRAVVRDPAYHSLIARTIAALVSDRERFIQTGVGWVISDLSKTHPRVAAGLVERHFASLSREVIRRHTRYLPDHAEYMARRRDSKAVPGRSG